MAIVLIIAGIACAAYGATIMLAWSGTPFFAVWLVIGALLVAWGATIQTGLWSAAPALVRRSIVVLCGVALLAIAGTQAAALSAFNEQGEDDLDCIIVLGAQVRSDGPSVVLGYRLDAACSYLTANPRTRCIVSGGQGYNEPEPEAHAMARYLVKRGIDPSRITIEDASRNTAENIANCLACIDPARERIGIVTNNFHVFRGCAIARKKGIAHVCGIAAGSSPWFLPNNMLRESFGIAKDLVCGNI